MVKNAWERWRVNWSWLFLCLLVVTLILLWTSVETLLDAKLLGTLLAILLGGWGYFSTLALARQWFKSGTLLVVYFGTGWLLWYAATSISPNFFLLLFALFPHVFIIASLGVAAALAAALNTLVLLQLQQLNPEMIGTWVLMAVITSLGGSILAYFIQDIISQSEERRRLIEQLEATRNDLAQTQREAGVLAERQRLAGELHDTITQGLIGIVMHLEAAENTGDAAHLAQAKQTARDSLREARQMVWTMQPVVLENRAFEDAARYVIAGWSKAGGMHSELTITGTPCALPAALELAALRVLQEALANTAKHARANIVNVTLSYMPKLLVLDVQDDGIGGADDGRGFGLANMQRRVAELGGVFNIESGAGEGTTITAQFPLLNAIS